MSDIPAPLVAPDVDLRNFGYMPLDVVRLSDSDLAATPDAEVFRAAVLSWCKAWHQVPAASLPDDDSVLARLLGYGRDVKGWQKLRDAGALHGFVLCADGRLYHPVVAEKATEAWEAKQRQRDRTEKARMSRLSQTEKTSVTETVTEPVTETVTENVTSSVVINAKQSKGEERRGEERIKERSSAPKKARPASEPDGFAEWYATFPRHEARDEAAKSYGKALGRADAETLLAGAKAYAAKPGRDPNYTKLPATWLNKGCWLDEETAMSAVTGTNTDEVTKSYVERMRQQSFLGGAK